MIPAAPPPSAPVLARVVGGAASPLLEIGGKLYAAAGALPAASGETFEVRVVSRDASGITLAVGAGLPVREASLAASLAALGVPPGPEAEAALELTLSLGRPVDASSLKAVAAEASRLAATFGREQAREIVFLILNRLPVNAASLRLAALHLSGAGNAPLSGDLTALLRSLANLFPGLDPARFAPDPKRPDGAALRALAAMLGLSPASLDLPGLLRGVPLLSADGLPDADGALARSLADRLDAAAFESGLRENRFAFPLPVTVDGRPADVACEFRREADGREVFAFSAHLETLGPVRATLERLRGALTVRLHAAGEPARRLLEEGARELASALAARGYACPAVHVHLADPAAIPLRPARPPAAPQAPVAVDVRI